MDLTVLRHGQKLHVFPLRASVCLCVRVCVAVWACVSLCVCAPVCECVRAGHTTDLSAPARERLNELREAPSLGHVRRGTRHLSLRPLLHRAVLRHTTEQDVFRVSMGQKMRTIC